MTLPPDPELPPDPGLPDPGLPDPGLPDPGLPDPGLPDPGLPPDPFWGGSEPWDDEPDPWPGPAVGSGTGDPLDDARGLEAADPAGMLRAIASGAAQVREATVLAAEAGVSALAADGRPRAVLVCGTEAAGLAGDVLVALAGSAGPVPVLVHRGYGLPAWAGPVDLVAVVDSPGSGAEVLSALQEAVRRGCRLLVVAREGSPLDDLGQRGRAVVVPVTQGRAPRASFWAMVTPLLVAGQALGLQTAPPQALEQAAEALSQAAERCRVDADTVVNPAKRLALDLDGVLPVLWGTSPLMGAVAARFAMQLNANAGVPAVWGVLPEVVHQQAPVLDGPYSAVEPGRDAGPGSAADPVDDDLFRDRGDDQDRASRLAIVLLRDTEEHARVAQQADALRQLAGERGVPVTELRADGDSAVARFASLVGLTDYASAYLALLGGTDPTPVPISAALSTRVAHTS